MTYGPKRQGDRPLEVREDDGSIRVLAPKDWAYDPFTPVGDAAFYYELFPHHGYEMIANNKIVWRHKRVFQYKEYPARGFDKTKPACCSRPADDICHQVAKGEV